MSGGGEACSCPERKKPKKDRAWHYKVYKGNYSAFSGYRFTPSNYSLIECRCCGAQWRSKMEL